MSAFTFETIETDLATVACDGDKGPSGHPRVFLPVDIETGQVVCPYCSRTYVRSGGHSHGVERAIAQEAPGMPVNALNPEKTH